MSQSESGKDVASLVAPGNLEIDGVRGEAHAKGYAEGYLAGQKLERERVMRIMANPKFRPCFEIGREVVRVGVSADAAAGFFAAAALPPVDNSPFAQAARGVH